jgi:CRISPR-associated endonuclease Csn1
MSEHLRYRIGIDVGLYSVGLAAIEIDVSDPDPLNALPLTLLSIKSVIHDGAVDPDSNKTAESRKLISGLARRTRRLYKQRRKRLIKLDQALDQLGYPVAQAESLVSGIEQTDPYRPWRARQHAAAAYIIDEHERKVAITIAFRHIARHRGWRNPYSSVASLGRPNKQNRSFYVEFFNRVQLWRQAVGLELELGARVKADEEGKCEVVGIDWNDDEIWSNRPTPAQLVEPMLKPERDTRIRRYRDYRDGKQKPEITAQIGKLHQSDNLYEIEKILNTQQVPVEEHKQLIEAIFAAINPRDKGAAAGLAGFDDLQRLMGRELRRASRASLAFQRFRIITTLQNLRIKQNRQGKGKAISRALSAEETRSLYDWLTTDAILCGDDLTWHDVAAQLGIDRSELKGVGGQTQDGEPISAKALPILNTEIIMQNLPKELTVMSEWWSQADDMEKEALIDCLSNAGLAPTNDLAEHQARASTNDLLESLGQLDEKAAEKLENIKLASGRSAYSLLTLRVLTDRMLADNLDLHTARKLEFGVDDDWHPKAEPLGTPTGNPAVDRTIMIVARWIKAVESRWGKPQTVNIEHVREGFMSPKKKREQQSDMERRYAQNLAYKKEIIAALKDGHGNDVRGVEAVHNADVRRWQAVQRQNCQCLYCGETINFSTAQMDHIVPRQKVGSTNTMDNLVAVCANCNKDKNDKLFSHWADFNRQKAAIKRVGAWNRDSYFTVKTWNNYKKGIISRLKQTEEDEPWDARSIESVAWMARELREQIRDYLKLDDPQVVLTNSVEARKGLTTDAIRQNGEADGNEALSAEPVEGLVAMQKVNVYKGWITSEARKAAGLESRLHWIGNATGKTRLDRRHHAIDAAVIALLRPAVATILIKRESLRRQQQDTGIRCRKDWEAANKKGLIYWKDYIGREDGSDSELYVHWRDQQMQVLLKLLNEAMDDDRIIVTNPVRLRLGRGRAHEDTVQPLLKRHVGDALTPINIDKAESPALWRALTTHPDYDPTDGLPADPSRRIRVQDKWLDANDHIGFMCKANDFDKQNTYGASYTRVRNGYAGTGITIHHARFYRIPKLNTKGMQTGWTYAFLRVFQEDLVRHAAEDLFCVEIPPQSISRRCAILALRQALDDGVAEYLGWAVVGDEVEINPEDPYFSPEGSAAINKFMKAFPKTRRFVVVGFGTNRDIKIAPIQFATEGLPEEKLPNDANENQREQWLKTRVKTYGGLEWSDEDVKAINNVIGQGGVYSPKVNALLKTRPKIIRRNTFGEERWRALKHMPLSWQVPPEPTI